ncbi:MAG TPA: dTDP-4-dehydrorhamnose 3,5-epimerase family protein [Pyrinomonadaceae bacterium]|nr:dTDP-4-dehydrorhamnose 3,5-epimerase family protein [Pyrinomonadaceae bacterium]
MNQSQVNPGSEPRLIEGAMAVDDRGSVSFVNDFDFAGVKRSYLVTNHRAGFVRAWHGHRREAKYVTVVTGAAIVAAVKIDNWESPSRDLPIYRHVLSAQKPSVLYLPAGYANGFMSLTEDATLMFFSTSTVEESRGDDIRFDARYWNAWEVVER